MMSRAVPRLLDRGATGQGVPLQSRVHVVEEVVGLFYATDPLDELVPCPRELIISAEVPCHCCLFVF